MNTTTPNLALQARAQILQARIDAIRTTIAATTGIARIEAQTRLADIEQRRDKLDAQLQALDGKGPGIWQSLTAEIELMADDLTSAVDDLGTGMAEVHTPPAAKATPAINCVSMPAKLPPKATA